MKTLKNGRYTLVGKDDIMVKIDEHDKIVNLGEVFLYFHLNPRNYFNKRDFLSGLLFKEALGKIEFNGKNKNLYEFLYECNNEYYKKIIKDELETLRNDLIIYNDEGDNSKETEMQEKINTFLREIIRLGHLIEIRDGEAVAVSENIDEYQRRLKEIIEKLYNVGDEAFDKIKLKNITDPVTGKISPVKVNASFALIAGYLNRVNRLLLDMDGVSRDFPNFDTINNEILTLIHKFDAWLRYMFNVVNEEANEIDDLINENEDLKRKNMELKFRVLRLSLSNKRLEDENRNLREEIIILEATIEDLYNINDYLRNVIREKDIIIDELRNKINIFRNKINNLVNKINNLIDENKDLRKYITELKVMMGILKNLIGKLKNTIHEKNNEIAELNIQIHEFEIRINILNDTINLLNDQITNLTEENIHLNDRITDLLNELKNYEKYVNDIDKEVKDLINVLNGDDDLVHILDAFEEQKFLDVQKPDTFKSKDLHYTLAELVRTLRHKAHEKALPLPDHNHIPLVIRADDGNNIDLPPDIAIEIISNAMGDMNTALKAQHSINSFICTINEVYASSSVFGDDKVKTYNTLFSVMNNHKIGKLRSDYNRIINNIHFISLYENVTQFDPYLSIKKFYKNFLGKKYMIFTVGGVNMLPVNRVNINGENSIMTQIIYNISTFNYKLLYENLTLKLRGDDGKKGIDESNIFDLRTSIERMKNFSFLKEIILCRYSKININNELKKLYIKQIYDIILGGDYVQLFTLNYTKIADPILAEDTVMRYNKHNGIGLGKKCIFYIFDYMFLIDEYPPVIDKDSHVISVTEDVNADEDENFVKTLYNTIVIATYEKFLQLTYPIPPYSSFSYPDLNDENPQSKTSEYFKGPCYNVLITNSVGAGLRVGAYSSYTEGTGVKYSILSLYQELKRNIIKANSFYGSYSIAERNVMAGGSMLKLENKITIYKLFIKFLLTMLLIICLVIIIIKTRNLVSKKVTLNLII